MSKKLKVGLISFHSFFQPGGVKRHILGLQKEFKKRGVYSKIIAPRRKKSENYGKNVILLGTSFPVTVSGTQSDFDINFNPLAIEKVLKKEKFDVLHLHNLGFPSAFQILERSNVLNILTIHANVKGSKFLKISGFLYFCKKIVQWKIDGIIGVAPLNLKIAQDFKRPKVVISNGIDLEEFNPRVPRIKKFLDGKINILFVGRIEERKGLIYLLRAYKILTKKPLSLRLIIVGDGPLTEDCQKYVKENDLKEVCFEGQETGKDLISYYTSSDIFCSPAIFGESFGLVLLEAMACGKPVVAFANEGYKEVLKNGKGERFLVKPRDYKTLAKKLEILIKNKGLRKEMGEWGRIEAKKYSWSKIADQVLDFYELCRQKKQKGKEKGFTIDKTLNKILEKTYTKDFLNWLKKLR